MSWQLYSFKTNTFTIQDENSGSIGTLILLQLETNCQIDFAYNYWPHKTIIFFPFLRTTLIALFLQRSGGFQNQLLTNILLYYISTVVLEKAQSANDKMRLSQYSTLLKIIRTLRYLINGHAHLFIFKNPFGWVQKNRSPQTVS